MLQHELLPGYTVNVVEDTFKYRPQFGKERRLMGLLREVLARLESPLLVDVGASAGAFSLLAATLPGLWGYAFEPLPETAHVLARNVAVNNLCGRVLVYPVAVAEKVDVRTLHVPDAADQVTLATLGEPRRFEGGRAVVVPTLPLDLLYFDRPPSVIKLDVEGAELWALQGAEALLKRYQPALLVEVENCNTAQLGYPAEKITEYLTELGYQSQVFKYNAYFWQREEHRP